MKQFFQSGIVIFLLIILVGVVFYHHSHYSNVGAGKKTTTLKAQLEGKTLTEKDNLIADEIIKAVPPQTFVDDKFLQTIQVKGVEKDADGDITVFVEAWKDGKQLGFGKDDTVETERIRIKGHGYTVYSTPDDYDYTETQTYSDGSTQTFYIKEDPELAFKRDLAHTLSIIGTPSNKIIKGTVGNTTTTVNPDADPETSTVDGRAYLFGSLPWDTVHDAASASSFQDDLTNNEHVVARKLGTDNYYIMRGFWSFDTSAIGTDSISSATFSIYVTGTSNDDNDGQDYMSIIESDPFVSDTAIGAGDYDACGATNNPTELIDTGERKDITSISTTAYLDFSLNATGIAAINKSGITYLCGREGHDIEDAPISPTGLNRVIADFSEGTFKPKLVIEHAAAGGGGGGAPKPQPIIMFE